jgi:type VI secretion system secreted protein VgrG
MVSSFKSTLVQAEGPQVTVASGDAFDVRQFTIHERISALFVVTIVAHSQNPSVDLDAVVGHPARFSLRSGLHDRTWTGLCSRLQQISVEEQGASTYHLEVVPSLWLSTQRRNYRMFQHQSELEVVLTLLGEWGVEPVKKLGGAYKKRKYRVQYAESDFSFMSRMLEDAGISFYFEQQGDETKLVLADAPQANEPRSLPLSYRDHPTSADREHVTGVRIGQQVRPGRVTMRDHDYRLPPEYKLLAGASGGRDVEQQLEQFHYTPGAFLFGSDKGESTPSADDRGKTRTDEVEGKLLAQKRLEALQGSAMACTFESNALDLAPGVVMSMLDHPHADLGPTKKLLVVESTMSGSAQHLSHSCEARSAALAYRPELVTPKPKVSGVESATVVGPKGEEIFTDEFGRVRVHFHWDRESGMNEKSSCWMHVSQAWAGAGFGTTHLPRVGQEVLVDFIGGDPDRPVVTGRLYTNAQKTPYKLPENKTQTGWKSHSIGGSGGYNEIMFEDLGGKELLRVQAEKDLHKLVKHDEEATVGSNRSHSVGNDDSLSVGNDRTEMVGNNETVTVGANQTVTVGANQTVTVGADQTETITGNRTLTLTGNLAETQVGNQVETLTGNRELTQVGKQSETIIGDLSLIHLGGQTEVQAGSRTLLELGGKAEIRLGNELHLQMGSETEIRAGASWRMQVGNQTETVTGVKKIEAPTVTIDAHALATVKAALIELIASGVVQIEGASVNLKAGVANVVATGPTTIKGSIVKLNC